MTEHEGAFSGEDPFPDDMEPPELLMEAAVRVLAAEGYRGLTLRKVAEKAEKNRGLVHYYFDSKLHLLRSLVDHINDGTERLIELEEDAEPVDRLLTVLQFHAYGPGGIDEAGRHYYLAILQLQALAAHDAELRDRLTRNSDSLIELVSSIIEEGIKDESFRPVNSEATAQFLLVAVDGARTADLALNRDTVRKQTLVTLEQFVTDVLMTTDR